MSSAYFNLYISQQQVKALMGEQIYFNILLTQKFNCVMEYIKKYFKKKILI